MQGPKVTIKVQAAMLWLNSIANDMPANHSMNLHFDKNFIWVSF